MDNPYRPVRTSVELSGSAARSRRCEPPPDLAPYVMDFWQYEVQPEFDYIPVQVFPSGCVVLRFNLRPDHVESVLYGPSLNNDMRGLFYHDWAIFGVALHPHTAYHLLGLSVHELRDLRILLECFWPARVSRLAEQLWATRTFGARVGLISGFLREVLRTDVSPHADFLNVFRDIVAQAPHAEDIGRIMRRHGACSRTVRRRFAKYLGLGPKQVDRLVRVQNVMRALCGQPGLCLADVAQAHGFSDQAHLSREFRVLTDYSPARFSDLNGSMHLSSNPKWEGMDTRWRHERSPRVIRFE